MEENLDFICYLNNVYRLFSPAEMPNKNISSEAIDRLEETAVDRVCSFLLADQEICEFEVYVPKEMAVGLNSRDKNAKSADRFGGRI